MPYSVFVLSYFMLWALFLLAMRWAGGTWPQGVSGIDVLLLCLATFRLTEVISEEKVARCLRAPFCELKTRVGPDGTESQEEVPMGRGARRMIGELMLCPWCTGIWVGTLLTLFWIAAPVITRMFLIAFAVAAGGVMFESLVKLMDRTRKSLPD